MRRIPLVIAGAGPAGSAAAIMLGRAGAAPLIIERQRETGDALCGGFLSWRSLEILESLGLNHALLGGHSVDHVRIITANHIGEARLPGPAIGISRYRLDQLLQHQAVQSGAVMERGVAIREAQPNFLLLADGGEITMDSLFLATGKQDCRGLSRPKIAPDADPALGLRLRIPACPGLRNSIGSAIELHLFDGGYAGLILQEDGSANLCMAVRKSRFQRANSNAEALLKQLGNQSAKLGDILGYAASLSPVNAIGAVPYGWRCEKGAAGLYRLGDQAAVIPSLAGEGMGIALYSGVMAAQYWLRHGPDGAMAYQTDLAARTLWPVRIAGWLRDAADTNTGRNYASRIVRTMPIMAAFLARLTRIG